MTQRAAWRCYGSTRDPVSTFVVGHSTKGGRSYQQMEAIEQGVSCLGCEAALPVRLAQPHEEAALWKCAKCERPYVGVCIPELLRKSAASLMLAECHFESSNDATIQFEMWQEAFQIAVHAEDSPYQSIRRERRNIQVARVDAVELSGQLQPIGESLPLIMTNVSGSGIGLVHNAKFEARRLAIQFPPVGDERIQVVVEIVRQDAWGDHFFDVGGTLIYRLGSQKLT